MPEPQPVILAPYDPEWPYWAARRAGEFNVLGATVTAVHHIGSTSVPGLAAKPVIDLMPLVGNLGELDQKRGLVEALGYEWRGEFGIVGRRFCVLDDEQGVRQVNAHFFEVDSPHARRHLAFRDYLCAHPLVAAEYEREKRRARDLHPDDLNAYCDEKDAWIRRMEAVALAWWGKRAKAK